MRSYLSGIALYSVLAFATSNQLGKTQIIYNEPKLLPDGVLINEQGRTLRHAATWNILITLDEPREEIGLRDSLKTIRQLIHGINQQRNSLTLNTTRHLWEGRLREIEDTMLTYMPGQRFRTRRGLLNIVGQISQKLFGTATEAQVEECRRLIAELTVGYKQVSHSFNELVTIINQTHNEVVTHRRHIRKIEKFVTNITANLNYILSVTRHQQEYIEFLNIELQINQALSAIEATHNHWLRQVDKHQRQKASLQLGWLTEELLPPDELSQIIEAAGRLGFRAPPLQWYYEHISIRPMWEDQTRLVFQAELPFSDDIPYLRYHIQTWSVPVNTSDKNLELQLPKDIAINTGNGHIFEPVMCLGNRPTICRTGPIYDDTRFPCISGLLSQSETLRKKCLITMSQSRDKQTRITEATAGLFVIQTRGETCSVHCTGRRSDRIQLTYGTYAIRPSMDCQIKGQGWMIAGIVKSSVEREFSMETLEVPPLALLNLTTSDGMKESMDMPAWETLDEIRDLPIDKLRTPPVPDFTKAWGSHAGHFSWITFILVCLIICAILYVGFVLRKKGILAELCPCKPGKDIADPAAEDRNTSQLSIRDRDPAPKRMRTPPRACPGMPQAWQVQMVPSMEDGDDKEETSGP